jgi:hypothetical protein
MRNTSLRRSSERGNPVSLLGYRRGDERRWVPAYAGNDGFGFSLFGRFPESRHAMILVQRSRR